MKNDRFTDIPDVNYQELGKANIDRNLAFRVNFSSFFDSSMKMRILFNEL